MRENVCKNCPYQYYVGKKYHSQLIKILLILAEYVNLQNIYESEET